MSNDTSKKDQFMGKAKKAAGNMMNDDKTKEEGKRQETEGKVKDAANDVKDKANDAFNNRK
ncbi:CsbD family protein [Salinicoccus hispanicus]|uniref:CsbD family protein n=1 Tax=Salinicoccus hispanicus TaxID=157225 RepID=A0A6N8TVE5_9STAP|nr:CsbD family protein [Salinicoccus hispanicus]MXQ49703.1 CsbD family protein [Salinicoccus hispanicus]